MTSGGEATTLAGIPSVLRYRLSLLVLLGVFLIPITASSLRGLTHVMTCRQATETPFTIVIPESGPPSILSSATIDRDDDRTLCGGLDVDTRVATLGGNKVRVTLPITNATDKPWKGSVALKMKGTTIPVAIGAIAAGTTRAETITLNVDAGTTEINGSLLIGP